MVRVTFLASPQPAWNHHRCGAKNCSRYSQRDVFLVSFQLDASSQTLEIVLSHPKTVTYDYSGKSKMKQSWFWRHKANNRTTESYFFVFVLIWICQNDLIKISASEAIMWTGFCQHRKRCRFSSTAFSGADQRRKIARYGVFFSLNIISPDLPD